ncbi:FAD-dependent oxidoreductase [Candidatus Zixiibacteriota bacterium]
MSGNGGQGTVLVIGGGISGITAAIEATEAGCDVIVVEKNAFVGGRVAYTSKYFPKMCPPTCGLEINLRQFRTNPHIRCLTSSVVEKIAGSAGDFKAIIKREPRFVNEKCTLCGECVDACPVDRPDEYNLGETTTKAIYLPFATAFPARFAIDGSVCPGTECGKCVEACPYDAIDLGMQNETIEVEADSVIWATGWNPPDATLFEGYGFGEHANVVTNVMMERYAALNGPTGGKIVKPSDGGEIESIAFVQCAGSRDENYYEHCSGVCCMASLKQVRMVREQYPDARIFIFYIDIRSPGRLEDFFTVTKEDEGLTLNKGKVAHITEDAATGKLTIEAEDAVSSQKITETVDMVVLATGMIPAGIGETEVEGGIETDRHGFLAGVQPQAGIFAAGVARRPADVATSVRDATSAAMKSLKSHVE